MANSNVCLLPLRFDLPPDRTVISRTRLSVVITIQIFVQMMECKEQSLFTLNTRYDKKFLVDFLWIFKCPSPFRPLPATYEDPADGIRVMFRIEVLIKIKLSIETFNHFTFTAETSGRLTRLKSFRGDRRRAPPGTASGPPPDLHIHKQILYLRTPLPRVEAV
ncbi:hypothetical protein EVAR_41163_1 [Eumeta japonica]|uniref:Uncharacterized protein n=1 Tax=Eumeta variegata TaxID=151549 RepID=A0A4C1YA80_EUMVA|nr:hypothetical protein EVAR_41163_1 [Eumeta japonica]